MIVAGRSRCLCYGTTSKCVEGDLPQVAGIAAEAEIGAEKGEKGVEEKIRNLKYYQRM